MGDFFSETYKCISWVNFISEHRNTYKMYFLPETYKYITLQKNMYLKYNVFVDCVKHNVF